MNTKTYNTLELNKILAQLAKYASFSASEELLLELQPTSDIEEAQRRQQETAQARDLLEQRTNATIGGARDVRSYVRDAMRGSVLMTAQLLEVKQTLQASSTLRRTILQSAERYPLLAEAAQNLGEGKHIVAAITRTIDEQSGGVLDSASPKLLQIRGDLRTSHDRLHSKLQAIINSSGNAPYLQEAIITMRSGRYVIPIKAEAKGRIKGIVHDQSASGATLFIEPLATVEINNHIRELELAEDDEVRRILSEITALIAQDAQMLTATVDALAHIDAAFGRAKYANALRANLPTLVAFHPQKTPGSTIRLYHARHPLLDQRKVVPIDVELDEDTYVLVITGPNTGGKTVSLKTVGLLVLMAQCGLHIPADEGSTLTVFQSVYADIGDEQSIEQSLSTFSSHLRNITGILDKADDKSLVLLDELGAGTDPAEGSALARALLSYFLDRGVTTFATTHYPELKLYAHSTPGVRNASVEFDVETLSPTYRLIVGLPGRSNALAIATRLGLRQDIIDEARSYVGEADLQVDNLLDEIHRTRDDIRQTQVRLVKAESDTRKLREELEDRLENIEHERADLLAQARAEAEAELEAVRGEVQQMRRRLQAIPPSRMAGTAPAEELKAIDADARALEESLEPVKKPRRRHRNRNRSKTTAQPAVEEVVEPPRALRPGDRVFVPTLNSEGEIVALHAGHDVEVQVGLMRVRVDADTLEYRSSKPPKEEAGPRAESVRTPIPDSPGMELHLRGYMVEDALPVLDEYLDRAYLSGLPWVHIVHGRGTGALRQAVREHLRRHPLVKEYTKAPENEGGDGVTVVRFVPLS